MDDSEDDQDQEEQEDEEDLRGGDSPPAPSEQQEEEAATSHPPSRTRKRRSSPQHPFQWAQDEVDEFHQGGDVPQRPTAPDFPYKTFFISDPYDIRKKLSAPRFKGWFAFDSPNG